MSIHIYTPDERIFYLINHLPHTPVTNFIGLALSGVGTVGIIWFLLGLYLFYREEKKDHRFFIPLFLAGGISYILSDLILKPLIARPRPYLSLFSSAIIVGENISNSYSMPSGHATIAFAMAVVLSRKEPKWRWMFYVLAVLISLSRIFLGKHYPLDVIVGGFLGWCMGYFSLWLAKRMRLIK